MVTAPDGEIQLWNETVTTRQVLRARIKPWRSMQGRLMWENRSWSRQKRAGISHSSQYGWSNGMCPIEN